MCPQSCIFTSCKRHNFPTHTSVLSEIFPTFLHCPQSSSSILPSSQDHPKGTFRKTSALSSSSPDFPRMFVNSLCVIQTVHVALPTQTGKQGYPPSPTDCCNHWKSLGCKQVLNSGFIWEGESTTPEVKEMLLQQLLCRFPLLPLHPETKYFNFPYCCPHIRQTRTPAPATPVSFLCPSQNTMTMYWKNQSGKENPNPKQTESLRQREMINHLQPGPQIKETD